MFNSICKAQLETVVGGGLSLGNRDATPPNPNPWAGPLAKQTFAPPGLSATIDPGMTKTPANPGMDPNVWKLPNSTGGGLPSGGLDL